jgi:hypothetical protein
MDGGANGNGNGNGVVSVMDDERVVRSEICRSIVVEQVGRVTD